MPRCFDWSGAARNAVCHPRTRPRNTPVVIDLATPREFHRMFTRPLSRCIDDVSRRLVAPIPIPPPPVCPRSVSPMACPYSVRDEFDPDFAQRYHPVLPFCSHCVSERCRKCRSQVRVRKHQQDATFNLIGGPRSPADALRLALRRSAHRAQYARALHNMREAAGRFQRRGPAREECAQRKRAHRGGGCRAAGDAAPGAVS